MSSYTRKPVKDLAMDSRLSEQPFSATTISSPLLASKILSSEGSDSKTSRGTNRNRSNDQLPNASINSKPGSFAPNGDVVPPDHSAPRQVRQFHPVIQWVLFLSKRYLQVPPMAKAVFYIFLVVLCSSLSPFVEPYRNFYLFSKHSVFNQWFVKLSWGWTFWLLLAFFVLCGYVESDGRLKKIAGNIARLLVGTAMWFVVTSSFVGIERTTGKCSNLDHIRSRKECIEAGSTWMQFDISGHAFLLIYCSLLILEESRGFFKWEAVDHFDPDNVNTSRRFDDEIKPRVVLVIHVLAVALALLAMLWDGMVVITLMYYHDFLQRLFGVVLGIAAWFVTYRVWYARYWPGLPGDMSPAPQES